VELLGSPVVAGDAAAELVVARVRERGTGTEIDF
jgi:hypothetical protein